MGKHHLKRNFSSFHFADIELFKEKMLSWSKQFSIFCFLDNQQYNFSQPAFDCVLAAGVKKNILFPAGNALDELDRFVDQYNDMLFGHFSYDLKNEIEELSSSLPDHISFPALHFFLPEILIRLDDNTINVGTFNDEQQEIFDQILATKNHYRTETPSFDILQRFDKESYCATVAKLQDHIHRGDCYEINFCQEFYAEDVRIQPLELFLNLTTFSPNPFSCFYKMDDKYLLCASPERYIKKENNTLISQPIKGTAKRELSDTGRDEELKQQLIESKKERAENVMIVDLVRNDLNKVCTDVRVQELFKIYSFPQVHQMISTITGEINPGTSIAEIIQATFPMGSMTGAPKKKVMELIEQYERTKRGLFSGSVGYIDGTGNFDFNVVIRSIQYNETTGYLSFTTGSAITSQSVPEQEYEECLLKAGAIKSVLSGGK